MKWLLFMLILALMGAPAATAQSRKRVEAETFRRHFKRLDSLALHSPTNTVDNCPLEVEFMHAHTGIASTANGGWAGLFHCYKSDLRIWHEWYDQKYERKKK